MTDRELSAPQSDNGGALIVIVAMSICFFVAVSLSPSPALAGEASARRVIGFSPDGAYFAFEEYGMSDPGMGQGDTHAYIDIIDIAKGSRNGNLSVAFDSDNGAVAASRRKAANAVSRTLKSLHIGARGRLIGADAAGRAGETFFYTDVWAVEKKAKSTLDVQAPELGGKAKLVLEYDTPQPAQGDGPDVEPSSETVPPFTLTLVSSDGKRT